MKIHELTRRAGGITVRAWPPQWTRSSRQDPMPPPDAGVLEAVRAPENVTTLLWLTMRHDMRNYMGILKWDAPPPLDAVESVLSANLLREIRVIGDLDI